MTGTMICAVTDGDESEDALAVGAVLSARLGLRLVLVRAVAPPSGDRNGSERRLAELAARHGVSGRAERRLGIGDPATLIGQIAADEAADVIVVGAPARGWRRRLDCRLADEIETATAVPVLIAPPRPRWPR